ncbi:MFS transporter [Pseudonocardia asaccharolytica]|uniref:MFS transporter n=1 Tax=Pseudonocardia asaccharolytica TaxID=54010 RepID=UPI000407B895|nr:MFS transporter [Pseudonocardia asaccharolytica]
MGTTLTTAAVAAAQRRVLVTLSLSQVLGGVGVATAIAISSLTASRLSGSEAVGGAAQTMVVLGAAASALVTARVATRGGRRPAITVAYAGSALGGAGAIVAVTIGNAAALLAALVLVGAATAAGLAARFAATDLAAPERRARALAMVVWATTVGAVAGPNLAGPTQDVAQRLGWEPSTGPFVLCTGVFALAAGISWLGLRPDPLLLARARADDGAARAVVSGAQVRAALRASPAAVLGLVGVALGHLVMVAIMSMTPVHMDHGGASLQAVGLVISLHVAGMYALSPLFGWLADRLGRRPVLALGAVLLVASGILSAMAGSTDHALLTIGLILLGLGWSAGLIAGSALLTESLPVEVRPRAQGLSDVTMNVAGAVGGIAGGLIVAATSFGVLGVVSAVLVLPFLVAAGASVLRPARTA